MSDAQGLQTPRSEKTAKIAKARLKEKSKKMEEMVERLETRLKSLEELKSTTDEKLQLEKDTIINSMRTLEVIVSEKFEKVSSSLHNILDQQGQFCKRIMSDAHEMLSSMFLLTEDASYVSLIQQYSTLSQKIEDFLICSLIVLDEESQQQINQLVDTIEALKNRCEEEDPSLKFRDAIQPISECLDDVAGKLHKVSEDTSISSEVSVGEVLCNNSISKDYSKGVEYARSVSYSPVSIPDLVLPEDTVFSGIVISVPSPTSFVVQCCGEDLARLSESVRSYVSQMRVPPDDYSLFKQNLVADAACCAQFTLDQSWYRVRVVSITDRNTVDHPLFPPKEGACTAPNETETKDVMVTYVDYGNQEALPLSPSHVLPLPSSLATLPAQALLCNLHDADNTYLSPADTIVNILHHWLVGVLSNTVVQVRVCDLVGSNQITCDLYVSVESILSDESMAFLKQIPLYLTDLVSSNETSVHLLCLLNTLKAAADSLKMSTSSASLEQSSTVQSEDAEEVSPISYTTDCSHIGSKSVEDMVNENTCVVEENELVSVECNKNLNSDHALNSDSTGTPHDNSHSGQASCDSLLSQGSEDHEKELDDPHSGDTVSLQDEEPAVSLVTDTACDVQGQTLLATPTSFSYPQTIFSSAQVSYFDRNRTIPYIFSCVPAKSITPPVSGSFMSLPCYAGVPFASSAVYSGFSIPPPQMSVSLFLPTICPHIPVPIFTGCASQSLSIQKCLPEGFICSIEETEEPVLPLAEVLNLRNAEPVDQTIAHSDSDTSSMSCNDSEIPQTITVEPVSREHSLQSEIVPVIEQVSVETHTDTLKLTPTKKEQVNDQVNEVVCKDEISSPAISSPNSAPMPRIATENMEHSSMNSPSSAVPVGLEDCLTNRDSDAPTPNPREENSINDACHSNNTHEMKTAITVDGVEKQPCREEWNRGSSFGPTLQVENDEETIHCSMVIKHNPNNAHISSSVEQDCAPLLNEGSKNLVDSEQFNACKCQNADNKDPHQVSNSMAYDEQFRSAAISVNVSGSQNHFRPHEDDFLEIGDLAYSLEVQSKCEKEILCHGTNDKNQSDEELLYETDQLQTSSTDFHNDVNLTVEGDSREGSSKNGKTIGQPALSSTATFDDRINEEPQRPSSTDKEHDSSIVNGPKINTMCEERTSEFVDILDEENSSLSGHGYFVQSSIHEANESASLMGGNSEPIEASVLGQLLDLPCSSDISDEEVSREEESCLNPLLPPPPEFSEQEVAETMPAGQLMGGDALNHGSDMTVELVADGQADSCVKQYSHIELKLDELSQFRLVVSHVVSPSQFYVFPLEQVGPLLYSLESSLYQYYNKKKNCKALKSEAIIPGTPCCLFNEEEGVMYMYRGLIAAGASKNFCDSSMDQCTVLCVDYGWTVLAPIASLFELDSQFFDTPVLITACRLRGIAPRQTEQSFQLSELSSSSETTSESVKSPDQVSINTSQSMKSVSKWRPQCGWNQECINNFISLVHDRVLVAAVSTDNTEDSYTLFGGFQVHRVLLFDTSRDQDVVINHILVEMGLAVSSNAVCKDLFNEEEGPHMEDWNPMENDFLSIRNTYSLDDEDVGSALLGQKSSQNVPCRLYNSINGCHRDNCPYQHLQEGVSDSHMEEVYAIPPRVALPEAGSWVYMIVTGVHSANRFMGHILGPIDHSGTCRNVCDGYAEFLTLLKEMDSYYKTSGHSCQLSSLPSPGELVAVWHESNGHWYRSMVTMETDDKVQVFYVDIGYEEIVPAERIRSMKPQFIHVPAQAVECCLSDTQLPTNVTMNERKKGKSLVYQLSVDKVLPAKVKWRSDYVLFVDLFMIDSNAEQPTKRTEIQSLNSYLICKGCLLQSKVTQLTVNQKCGNTRKIVFRPG